MLALVPWATFCAPPETVEKSASAELPQSAQSVEKSLVAPPPPTVAPNADPAEFALEPATTFGASPQVALGFAMSLSARWLFARRSSGTLSTLPRKLVP